MRDGQNMRLVRTGGYVPLLALPMSIVAQCGRIGK